jgi:hypothetical protein
MMCGLAQRALQRAWSGADARRGVAPIVREAGSGLVEPYLA